VCVRACVGPMGVYSNIVGLFTAILTDINYTLELAISTIDFKRG